MKTLFSVTYEVITPESAEFGDVEDRGFIAERVTLREAIEYLGYGSQGCEADCYPISTLTPPRWLTMYCTNDGTRAYFEQGIHENRSIHFPDNITPSSAMRIAHLLGASC